MLSSLVKKYYGRTSSSVTIRTRAEENANDVGLYKSSFSHPEAVNINKNNNINTTILYLVIFITITCPFLVFTNYKETITNTQHRHCTHLVDNLESIFHLHITIVANICDTACYNDYHLQKMKFIFIINLNHSGNQSSSHGDNQHFHIHYSPKN